MTDMARRKDLPDPGEAGLRLSAPKHHAAGIPAVLWTMRHGIGEMGVTRTLRTLLRINQADGFDCPGCAWPEHPKRHVAEFCENGAKAVSEEATVRRAGPELFVRHSVSDLAERSDYWLGKRGRLTHPMHLAPGAERYEPISWADALGVIARELAALDSPDEAIFYTSGRTSNEAAFVYQAFVRAFGTNNLPDCSNMCHESSGVALSQTIGAGKGSVSIEDVESADLIVVVGQNPGTNHPRMLSSLEAAKRRGARIVSINPLPEAGLQRFKNPQRPNGILGRGTALADMHLHIRVNGDLALFQAINHQLIAADRAAPGTVIDHDFVNERCTGFDELSRHLAALNWDDVLAATGLRRDEIEAFAALAAGSRATVVCWAMGLTQHRNAVATIQEVVNFLLLRGHIGKPGAGVCPVRGHSNVQGDRTMGIYEKPSAAFLDSIARVLGFEPPRHHGYDTVEAIRAMRDGHGKVFFAMGGNFAAATPDTAVTEAALRRCRLTVHVSTKLNRSHTVCGEQALILPCLGRTERDVQAAGEQIVTVEDSMSLVHASRGRLAPASEHLRSEVAIVCGLAERVLGADHVVAWRELGADYRRIRELIAAAIPGFGDFERRLQEPGGFVLPHRARDERRFDTPDGRARLTVNQLEVLQAPPGHLILQTLRSHDQYNTTIYGLNDRYRGVKAGRRVVLVNPGDRDALGFAEGDVVDLVGTDVMGAERRVERFRVVGYPTAAGCAAAYYPETNGLVPLDSVAEGSGTPTSKSIVIRLERASRPPGG
jgi:molybdopterin-dependent oxidoreductase alpha subunit